MKVLKFGGTSVGTASNIKKVKAVLEAYLQKNQRIAVVVSAQSGVTNLLERMGTLAANSDDSYKALLQEVEELFVEGVEDLQEMEMMLQVR